MDWFYLIGTLLIGIWFGCVIVMFTLSWMFRRFW